MKKSYFCGWLAQGSGIAATQFVIGQNITSSEDNRDYPNRLLLLSPVIIHRCLTMNDQTRKLEWTHQAMNDALMPISRTLKVNFNLDLFNAWRYLDEEDSKDAERIKIYENTIEEVCAQNAGLHLPSNLKSIKI